MEESDASGEVDGPPDTQVAEPIPTSEPAGAVKAMARRGSAVDRYRVAFVDYTEQHGAFPDGDQLAKWLFEQHGVGGRSGEVLSSGHLRRYL